jgi:alkaline phosphatase D
LLLGDQIYADHRDEDDPARPFLADPQAVAAADEDTLLQLYWSKYRRNFADQGFRSAAETVPLFMVWDDHELVNDFAGERTTPLYRAARRAYEAYQHGHNPDSADVGELYYVIRASEELEIFVLDGRSFRSEGRVEQPRSLLGRKQRERLLRWLLESRAAVKVIASPVMWADQARFSLNERGAPYLDSWYLFADEREHILRFVLANRVHGVVLISGDAHWAAAYRFERRAEGARYTFVELSASPLAHVGLATPVVPRDAAASMTSELLASFRPSPPAPGEPLGGFYGSAELFSNGSLRLALCATPGRRVLFEMLLQPHELRVQDDGASHYDQAHVRRGAERERDGGQGPAAQSSVDRTHAGLRLAAGAGILVLVSVIALRVVFHAMLRPRQTKEKS